MSATDQKIPQLIEDVANNLGDIVRNELKLARVETSKGVSDALNGAVYLAAAVALGIPAITVLAAAIVQAMIESGMEGWAASVIVAMVMIAAALLLFLAGRKTLHSRHTKLETTSQNIKQDIKTVKGSMR